jgi:uncharacterized membrane protein YagU involved in acid resistance
MSDAANLNNSREADVLKGLVAGLVGGLFASWTMNRFQDAWLSFSENGDHAASGQSRAQGEDTQLPNASSEQPDDATVRAASAISESLFDHKLTQAEKKMAGPAVHYALGTGVGGLYGAVAEVMPDVTLGSGLPFGAAFWLVVDETAVPVLGLSKPPTAYPVSTHFYALASHLVYGLTAEFVRRSLRKAL